MVGSQRAHEYDTVHGLTIQLSSAHENAHHRCFAFVLLYEYDPSVEISLRYLLTSHLRNDIRDILVPE